MEKRKCIANLISNLLLSCFHRRRRVKSEEGKAEKIRWICKRGNLEKEVCELRIVDTGHHYPSESEESRGRYWKKENKRATFVKGSQFTNQIRLSPSLVDSTNFSFVLFRDELDAPGSWDHGLRNG